MCIVNSVHTLATAAAGESEASRASWQLARSQLAMLTDVSGWTNVVARLAARAAAACCSATGPASRPWSASSASCSSASPMRWERIARSPGRGARSTLASQSAIGTSSLTTAELQGPALPAHQPVVGGDRRPAVRVEVHDQDPLLVDLPEVGRHHPVRGRGRNGASGRAAERRDVARPDMSRRLVSGNRWPMWAMTIAAHRRRFRTVGVPHRWSPTSMSVGPDGRDQRVDPVGSPRWSLGADDHSCGRHAARYTDVHVAGTEPLASDEIRVTILGGPFTTKSQTSASISSRSATPRVTSSSSTSVRDRWPTSTASACRSPRRPRCSCRTCTPTTWATCRPCCGVSPSPAATTPSRCGDLPASTSPSAHRTPSTSKPPTPGTRGR